MERQTSASSVDPRLKDLALRSKIKRKITIRKRMKSRIKSRSKTAELIRTPSPSLARTLLPNPILHPTLARRTVPPRFFAALRTTPPRCRSLLNLPLPHRIDPLHLLLIHNPLNPLHPLAQHFLIPRPLLPRILPERLYQLLPSLRLVFRCLPNLEPLHKALPIPRR